MLIVKLPFPDRSLMPNRKNGKSWKSTVGAKNAQKEQAAWLTKKALGLAGPQDFGQGNVPLSLLFLLPDKRARDLDNLLAASKALLDAVSKELGIDDRRFKPLLLDSVLGPKEGGLIVAVGVKIESAVSFE